jgi:hypothetical protein
VSGIKDLVRGYGPSLLIGVGLSLVVPVDLPVAGAMVRPLLKGALKGGFLLVDRVGEFAAETGEHLSDLVAEARYEHYGKTDGKSGKA